MSSPTRPADRQRRRGRPRPEGIGRRAALVSKRGRFFVAGQFFEPGPEVALDRRGPRVQDGKLALVEFGPERARVLEELGSPERAADVIEALIRDRGVERGFTAPIESEAEEAAAAVAADLGERRDLTEMPTLTVDPASARDFDDAVSAEREGDGIRLWIHIADVAAHVRPGSALEAEARARGTSTYVPGSVEPMLPLALSAHACSLAAGVVRPAVTAEILLSGSGEARSASFYRSIIRSDARLDYDQLDEFFAGRATPPSEVAAPLDLARRAAALLAERRSSSALTVDSREPEFVFDANGDVLEARMVEQTEAHRLIEHLMILTNEQVALLSERRKVPTLYRVHEPPDPQRIEFLAEQLASLEVPTPPVPKRLSSQQAGELAGEMSRLVATEAARRGHGRAAYTSLVLRSLKQAYYSHENLGHAGLGSPAYLHFTSPIRRYPDLVAHRALLSLIGEGEDTPNPRDVAEAGVHSSAREREAMQIERSADDVCAAFLLKRELFASGWEREFEGEVAGVIGAGAFVSFGGDLGGTYEGMLPVRRLRDDHYDLNETETALVGKRTGRAIRLGDPIKVRVDGVETARGRVDLVFADDGAQRRGKAQRGGGPAKGQQGGRPGKAKRGGKPTKQKGGGPPKKRGGKPTNQKRGRPPKKQRGRGRR